MRLPPGILTISIDFELYWGTRDHRTLEAYGPDISGGRTAIPAMLELFEEFGIHATWAVVGFVMFEDASDLRRHLPRVLPRYAVSDLDPYTELDRIGTRGWPRDHFFAPELVEQIKRTPGQELASHTFSHYYCLEPGQTVEAFAADLESMRDAARAKAGEDVKSLVFPRNQFNRRYLDACAAAGIRAYRGNPRSWAYEPKASGDETLLRRALRLADSYVNLTGHHGRRLTELAGPVPRNVPASRFLRPWSRRLRALEPLRLRRIRSDLSRCARSGLLYHLWWHPENFGRHTTENLTFLRRVLSHFAMLRTEHGMQSLSMAEVEALLESRSDHEHSAGTARAVGLA